MDELREALKDPLLPRNARRLASLVDDEELAELVRRLVPIGQPGCGNSIDPEAPEPNERPVAEAVAGYLGELGMDVRLVEPRPGRASVVGRWHGQGTGPRLLLNDHLDTYPVFDSEEWHVNGGDPYRVVRDGDRLYGRGTSDTRGNLASQLMAVSVLRRAGFEPASEVVFAYTCDEERNSTHGATHLLEHEGLDADFAIVSEPTSWTDGADWGIGIATAHSGHMLLDVEIKGERSHIWRPDSITNLAHLTGALLAALAKAEFSHDPPAKPAPTPPSVCPVRIQAGHPLEAHFTPARAVVRVAVVGLVPGMTQQGVVSDIESALQEAGLGKVARVLTLPGPSFVPGTREVPEDSLVVTALEGAYCSLTGRLPRLYRKNAYCDTIRFVHAGIPAVTFGPGEDAWHPTNEYVSLQKMVLSTRVLVLALAAMLSGAVPGERNTEGQRGVPTG